MVQYVVCQMDQSRIYQLALMLMAQMQLFKIVGMMQRLHQMATYF